VLDITGTADVSGGSGTDTLTTGIGLQNWHDGAKQLQRLQDEIVRLTEKGLQLEGVSPEVSYGYYNRFVIDVANDVEYFTFASQDDPLARITVSYGDMAALAVNRILPDDFSDDSATTGVIAPDGYATVEVENPNDADWFSVEFVEGTIYLIDLQGVDGSGESSLNLAMAAIYDASGTLLNASSDMSID